MMTRWGVILLALQWLMVLSAVVLGVRTLQQERKTRHRLDKVMKDRSCILRDYRRIVEDARFTEEEIDGLRDRIEAMREAIEELGN